MRLTLRGWALIFSGAIALGYLLPTGFDSAPVGPPFPRDCYGFELCYAR